MDHNINEVAMPNKALKSFASLTGTAFRGPLA